MTNELIRTIRHGERKIIWADAQPEQEPKLSDQVERLTGAIRNIEKNWENANLAPAVRHAIKQVELIDAQPEQDASTTPSASETLDRIHRLLSGHEWDSDTTAEIAEALASAGYEILEYEPTHDYA